LWESVEAEACPRNHAILLESVVVHDLEPGSQCIRQLILLECQKKGDAAFDDNLSIATMCMIDQWRDLSRNTTSGQQRGATSLPNW
jgi:hypothetical protein